MDKERNMNPRRPNEIVLFCTLAFSVTTGAGAPATTHAGARPIDSVSVDGVPGAELPAARVHHYRMSGAVRPLVFWFGRDNIGLARITWRRGSNGACAYELLVGTDPLLAPRSLNRWGYIAEETFGPANGSLLAMMTGSRGTTYDQEAARSARREEEGDFSAIRSRLENGAATWQVASVRTPVALTIRDVDSALRRVREDTAQSARRERPVSSDSRSGFLVAVAELLDVAVQGRSGPAPGGNRSVRYVFGGDAYELQLRSADPTVVPLEGRPTPAVRASFDIRTLATGERTSFDLTTATRGALAGVPLKVEWQPRWWLKVRLDLDEQTD
jgi:hypothetical protein